MNETEKAPENDLEIGKVSHADLLLTHLQVYESYHTQKENMTWAAATLYVSAAVLLLVLLQVRHPRQSRWLDEWGRLKGDRPSL